MKIKILTLFPQVFQGFITTSMVKKIIEKKIAEIEVINFRDYSKENNKSVDDYQIGGGGGMVLALQPIIDCLKANRTKKTKVFLLTPQTQPYTQQQAQELSKYEEIILICGHYEGFDERIENYIDGSISIGDYILTGGEIPAMVVVESVIRLLDGALTKTSLETESYTQNLLDYPIYTKPIDFEGHKVPEVLLSGNHKKIAD
jgi:tRNA (guanine37-N1)-methyltransferase